MKPSPACKSRRWRRARQFTQILFLLFFGWLMIRGHGQPAETGWETASAVNPRVIFLTDPLTWIAASISSHTIIVQSALWILILTALTLLFGRIFCGWICPLGTLVDASGRFLRPKRHEIREARARRANPNPTLLNQLFTSRTKYYILIGLFVLALLGVNAAGWLDPLAILTRATGMALVPAGEWTFDYSLGRLSRAPWIGGIIQPFVSSLREWALGPTPHSYNQGLLHLIILVIVLGLSRIRRRYWCHVLCPLGALWGWMARIGIWKRRVIPARCNECSTCALMCRMEAIPTQRAAEVNPSECRWCMECADVCPRNAVEFTLRRSDPDAQSLRTEIDLTRRGVIAALGSGLVVLPLIRLTSSGRKLETDEFMPLAIDEYFLRPPGARRESDFLRLCIRCGECYKICPQNALHPALIQGGLEGLWTPTVLPRLGYCDPSCTLCTETCPTTALRPMNVHEKRKNGRLGTARFDRSRCLPWSQGLECSVCEEMCPVSPKAIQLRKITVTNVTGKPVEVRAPVVFTERCIGCGMCENKCPIEGPAAVRVTRHQESRHISS